MKHPTLPWLGAMLLCVALTYMAAAGVLLLDERAHAAQTVHP